MRKNLSSLYTYITTVNFDTEKLNEYDKINYEAITARGEIWDGMAKPNDVKPVQGIYIDRKQGFFEVNPTPKG